VKHWTFLTGDTHRDQRNVDLLLGAVEELYGRGDLDALVRSAVDRAIQVTGAQRGVLLLADATGGLAVRLARSQGRDLQRDLRYSRSVANKVWTSGKPHLTVDAEGRDGGGLALGRSILDLRLLSILAVPLPVKDRSIGVLYVDSTAQAKEFTEADRTVFEALAGLVAVAIENARLAAEEAERQRLAREMDVARKIQQSLQPRDLPAPAGYDLAAEARACDETSGDYYDAIPLGDGTVGLVVGDVSGHGLGAALFMACVRALLRTLLHTQRDPIAAFSGLNAFLCRDMPAGSFMSLFLGILDPKTDTLRYVSAGHNPPLLRRPGAPLRELERTAPVLGVVPDHVYEMTAPIALRSGDVLVLYTDGLFEARDAGGEIYGEDRLHASLERHAARAPDSKTLLAGLVADLGAHVGRRPMDDDVTCMVLRVAEGGGRRT
jgi:sigma-B regulation protein RsbU (phosphoserine phosphatase)